MFHKLKSLTYLWKGVTSDGYTIDEFRVDGTIFVANYIYSYMYVYVYIYVTYIATGKCI